MAIREIYKKNEEILRKNSRKVNEITPKILQLLDDMAETMYDANGCGLAAPQVGILKQVVVLDDGNGLLEMINPEIYDVSEETVSDVEGCLSCPGEYGYVERPVSLKCDYYDRDGNSMTIEAEDFLARIICHEVAHLSGGLFIDISSHMLSEEELREMQEES